MELKELAKKLKDQVQSAGQIVLDNNIISPEETQKIRTAFALGEINFTLSGLKVTDIPDPENDSLTIKAGTSSLLGCAKIPIELSFTSPSDTLQVTIAATMASDWQFSASFPSLTVFPFTALILTNPVFVYASSVREAFPWPSDGVSPISLAEGLNFLAEWGPGGFPGIAGLLGSLISDKTFPFYGPFSPVPAALYPVGRIAAPLGGESFTIGTAPFCLTLAAPSVGVEVTGPEEGLQYVCLSVGANLEDKLGFRIGISEEGSTLVCTASPLPGKEFTADDIIKSLPGGKTFKEYIPGELNSIFEQVGLKSFFLSLLLTSPQKIGFLSLSIGTETPWQIIQDILTLEDLTLRINTAAPGGAAESVTASVCASARFLPQIFSDEFHFAIDLAGKNSSGWEISTISGTYFGGVTFAAILQGVVGASVAVPEELQDIVFSDFGITLVKESGSYAYTLFGSCDALFPFFGTQLNAGLSLQFGKTGPEAAVDLAGNIGIGEQNFHFSMHFSSGTAKDLTLHAQWSTSGSFLGFDDIASAFGFDMPPVPPELDLALQSAEFHYDFSRQTIVLEALSAHYGQAAFVALGHAAPEGKGGKAYLFSLSLDLDLSFSDLPLVGKVFAGEDLGGIENIQVVFASEDVTAKQVGTFNQLLPKPIFPVPGDRGDNTVVIRKSFNFAADIALGGEPVPLSAGGDTAPVTGAAPPSSQAAVPPAGNASWFDVKKSIGPVTLERIGVRYEDGRVWLLLDGSLMLSMLTFGLQGLGVGFKLSKDPDPAFLLNGMSLVLKTGELEIAGGFLNFSGDYLGEAIVQAASFSLTAIGGYAPSEESFFIFARLDTTLGGPPFFFITGLAGGFGINRSLILPEIDQLPQFALLPQNNSFPLKLDSSDPGGTLASTLASTAPYIHPEAGEYWIAAGIDFTSFRMIEGSAVLTVAFGVNLEIALLGIAHVTIPKESVDPIVYLEIALEARFIPADGVIAIDGRLTPASFLYSGLCRISGGYAFYMWVSGEHEGEFVVSIGGYHPDFKKPDYYPTVPRLQMIYKVGDLVMKGECYLALTSHMVMAGFRIEATWKSGDIKAWFDAGIDFLLGWRPFHYQADAYIHLGASFKLNLLFTSVTISIHVGVDLAVWGPPFGGKAKIDLDIISFTIRFGADQRHDTVSWEEFKQSFLPVSAHSASLRSSAGQLSSERENDSGDGNLCSAQMTKGLLKNLKAKDKSAFFNWIADPNHFVLESQTIIPSKSCVFNDFTVNKPFKDSEAFTYRGPGTAEEQPTPLYDKTEHPDGLIWDDTFGVLPMGLGNSFSTAHTIDIKKVPAGKDYSKAENYTESVNNLSVTPVLKNSQAALWASSDPGLNGERLVRDVLTGLRISPMIRHPEITLKADLWAMLFDQTKEIGWFFSSPAIAGGDAFQARVSDDGNTVSFILKGKQVSCTDFELTVLSDPAVEKEEKSMVESLASLGLALNADGIDLSRMAAYPLWDWPIISLLGEEAA